MERHILLATMITKMIQHYTNKVELQCQERNDMERHILLATMMIQHYTNKVELQCLDMQYNEYARQYM